jgi:TRAP-type mannitol/chloroaromatic compound transport system permease large subunit
MTYAILLGGIFIGLPIAFAIIAALLYFMAVGEFPYHLRIVATQMFGGMASYPLLAIPLFILAGELMNESGITSRIIAFANVLVGKMRAGLAMVNI